MSSVLNIEYSKSKEGRILVFGINGQIELSYEYSGTFTSIDVSQLSAGLKWVMVTEDMSNHISIIKIVKL